MLVLPLVWTLYNVEQWFAFGSMLPAEILISGGFFIKKLEPVIHLGFSNIIRNILLISTLFILVLTTYSIYSKSNFHLKVFVFAIFFLFMASLVSILTAIFSNTYTPGLISAIVLLLPYSIFSVFYLRKTQVITYSEIYKYYLPSGLILYYPITAMIWYIGVLITRL